MNEDCNFILLEKNAGTCKIDNDLNDAKGGVRMAFVHDRIN